MVRAKDSRYLCESPTSPSVTRPLGSTSNQFRMDPTVPFEIGHSNSIRLDQFRKNSWCSVGIDGYREAFVRPAWISMLSGGSFPILPYAGEIAPVPHLVAEQERLSKDCSLESFLHRSR